MANKISSNETGLAFAEEASLGVLPGVAEADATWYELEPNSYNDFGGQPTALAREPINATRKRKKGNIVDLDASGGFNIDFTKTNLQRLLQGFFFADMREKPTTAPMNSAAVVLTAVAAGTDDEYQAAAGLGSFLVNQLVYAEGFNEAQNNGLKVVDAVSATDVSVTTDLVVETPPATAKLTAVGYQFPASDATFTASATSLVLASAAIDLTTLGLIPGEWVHIGGDAEITHMGTSGAPVNRGYARVHAVTADEISFSDVSFAAVTNAGTGKTLQLFFGTVLRDEDVKSLIVQRTYNFERRLGEDDDGEQAEYLIGGCCNEMSINVASADKVSVDLSIVAIDHQTRTGAVGLKAGTRVAAPGEPYYNTSSDVYRQRLSVVDPTNLLNDSLIGFVSEMTVTVNNGVEPLKAIGTLGAFDTNVGNFVVGGSLEAYFATVAAVAAIRANADVAYNAIFAANNAGCVVDIPLLGLGDGRLAVALNTPITMPLTNAGAESEYGHTLLMNFFHYLPTVAMP